MAKKKKEPEDDYYEDEDYEDLNNSNQDNDEEPLEYQRHEGDNERIVDRPTIDKFFDTENLLISVEKTMKGYQRINDEWVLVTKPMARDEFINTMVNALRSVINQQNMISSISDEDSEFLLLEKNKEFIFRVYEEPSIDDEDVETIINIFDHSLQLFMGQVLSGFGARTLRQISANVSYEVPDKKNDDGVISFGVGNTNLFKIGGKK